MKKTVFILAVIFICLSFFGCIESDISADTDAAKTTENIEDTDEETKEKFDLEGALNIFEDEAENTETDEITVFVGTDNLAETSESLESEEFTETVSVPETTREPEDIVVPETTKSPEATKAPETTKKEETTKKQETTKKEETTKKKETTKENSPAVSPNSKTVYRTPSGKRYHLDPDCGGKNSYAVTLDKAKSSGLTPCKKCAQ